MDSGYEALRTRLQVERPLSTTKTKFQVLAVSLKPNLVSLSPICFTNAKFKQDQFY